MSVPTIIIVFILLATTGLLAFLVYKKWGRKGVGALSAGVVLFVALLWLKLLWGAALVLIGGLVLLFYLMTSVWRVNRFLSGGCCIMAVLYTIVAFVVVNIFSTCDGPDRSLNEEAIVRIDCSDTLNGGVIDHIEYGVGMDGVFYKDGGKGPWPTDTVMTVSEDGHPAMIIEDRKLVFFMDERRIEIEELSSEGRHMHTWLKSANWDSLATFFGKR